MFNMGFSELVILGIIGLVVLGPEQLPVIARKLARLLNELKRVTDEAINPVDQIQRKTTEFLHQKLAEHPPTAPKAEPPVQPPVEPITDSKNEEKKNE
jgi:sec-independent protein translocase protein TatB